MTDDSPKQQVESPLVALVRVRKEAQQAVARFHAEVEADRLAIRKLLSEPTDTEAHKPESRPEQRRKDDAVGVARETGAQAGDDEKNFSRPTDPDTQGAEATFTRYDIVIWERIKNSVEWRTASLVEDIHKEISKDHSLLELQGMYPVPWQLTEVIQQRAESWVQRLYDACCDVYKRSGNQLSVEFDRAVWAYCVEPFIMREMQTNAFGYRASKLLELLLCAVGSPPENRRFLKVGQKDCCLAVRNMIWQRWHDKLHHLPSTIDEAAAAIASFNEMRGRAARIVTGLASETSPVPPAVPAPVPQPSAMPEDAAMSLAPVLPKSHVETPPVGSEDRQHSVSSNHVAVRAGGADAATWEGIEITFLSDERVQIHIGKTHETRNYAEFGFQDNKSKNPNRAWETLRRLAELRGIIRDGTQAGLPWPKLEKRVQEIRRVFRKHFSISADPLPFIKGTGFHARFKISCGPSFRS